MADSNEELAFNEAIISRVKQWREEKGWTAEQMAIALGIPAERYRKYEYRTPLPPYLFERFCIVTDASLENLVVGTQRKRAAAPKLAKKVG